MKKILILAGRPIGSIELVKKAKEIGLYTIVTDYLSLESSPAKQIADESWDISTNEVESICRKCVAENIDYVTTGVHEFNINRMLEVVANLSLPCYCNNKTWKYCDNKVDFKQLCKKSYIPVAKTYDIGDAYIDYPVITKPIDGSGSRGFHVCENQGDLLTYYEDSKKYSPSQTVIIEEFIPYDAVIIHYTMINGKCFYSGMSDKVSVKFQNSGASVMGIQTFPSKGENTYLSILDAKVRRMFENAGFVNGPIWIEAFYNGNESFVFNEMGYRFGGSLTYYPVKYFYNIDQLELYVKSAMGLTPTIENIERVLDTKKYCILPIHINAGKITKIIGLEQLNSIDNFYAIAQVHFVNDEIQNWGSAQQVFCYLHLLYENNEQLKNTIKEVLESLKVFDEKGSNMIYTLFNVNNL